MGVGKESKQTSPHVTPVSARSWLSHQWQRGGTSHRWEGSAAFQMILSCFRFCRAKVKKPLLKILN